MPPKKARIINQAGHKQFTQRHKSGNAVVDSSGYTVGSVRTKTQARKVKHAVTQTKIKGVSTRKMANVECGKGGPGWSCTRPRGHVGHHYATHPPLTRQNIPGKRR